MFILLATVKKPCVFCLQYRLLSESNDFAQAVVYNGNTVGLSPFLSRSQDLIVHLKSITRAQEHRTIMYLPFFPTPDLYIFGSFTIRPRCLQCSTGEFHVPSNTIVTVTVAVLCITSTKIQYLISKSVKQVC